MLRRTLLACSLVALTGTAFAQTEDPTVTAATRPLEATAAQPPAPAPPGGVVLTSGRATLTLAGYAETYWQYNFNAPGNGVTAWRGFDNRHNTITISNVVIDASWRYRIMQGRVALQVGATPDTYYQSEPSRAATPGGIATGPDAWKFIQQANVGFHWPGAESMLIEAGIFLSPIGPEAMSVRENWNWSRSNLFYGLPYYHTGLRATYSPNGRHALALMVSNGWNSVVDNNPGKSVMAQYTYTPSDDTTFSVLYFGGIEREENHPAGAAWRNLLDAYVRFRVGRRLSLMVHGNAGFEPAATGMQTWLAGALYARVELTRTLRLAARVDYFMDSAPAAQNRIFWPCDWMSSQTLTLDVAPVDHVLFRAEYRHDIAEGSVFYSGSTTAPGSLGLIPNARSQDTITAGLVAWF